MRRPTHLDGLKALLFVTALFVAIVVCIWLRFRFDVWFTDWRVRRAMVTACRSHPIRPASIAPTRSQSHVANGAVWVCPTRPGDQWHVRVDRAPLRGS